MLRLQQAGLLGRRGYSIMGRAKQQAGIPMKKDSAKGIPRDLIKPKRSAHDHDKQLNRPRENRTEQNNWTRTSEQNGWTRTPMYSEHNSRDLPMRSREDRIQRNKWTRTTKKSESTNDQPPVKPSIFIRPAETSQAAATWVKRGMAKSIDGSIAEGADASNSTVIPLGAPRSSHLFHEPRQPAGLGERLAKIYKDFPQPPNPRLLRVAVIGAANAGKSTLMNGIIGEEVSVVSHKAHTTRERVLGVLTDKNHQLVFLDTPGVVPDNRHAKMNRTLVTSSWRSLDEADHVILMVDGAWALNTEERKADELILSRLSELTLPTTLVINKMDLVNEEENADTLKKMVDLYRERCPAIANVIYISALQGDGLEAVKNDLFMRAKPANWMYPKELKNDMPDLKRAEELIRVEFFKRLHQYIPYMLKQENVGWTELPNGVLRIDQNVYVERESQLKIVVGANGSVIDRVVEDARQKIAGALKRPVQLYIQVKTRKR